MLDSGNKDSVSRREFLQQTGAVIGGITLASLGVSTSCTKVLPSDKPIDTTEPTGTTKQTGTTKPTDIPTSLFPPPANPPLLEIPGCDAHVALDRKYSPDHIWVLPSQDNKIVLIGVTSSFVRICGGYSKISIRDVGTVLNATREDAFGWVNGYKIVTDIIVPVSGAIMEAQDQGVCYEEDCDAVYTDGLAVIQLSNPDELNKLYTPQYYAYLQSPSWSGPIPPMY